MEVKPRYKQTEAGLIPDDWSVRRLAELATYRNGKSYEDQIVERGDYFLITLDSMDINGNLKSEHKQIKRFDGSLSKDDLVMILSDVAHGNFLGLTDLIPQSHKYVLNQRVGSLQGLRGVDPRFLSEFINSRQIYFKTCGQGSSQQNLAKNDILNFLVLVPPLPEQRSIAMALTDVDAVITALDKLIAKKRDLKRAAMQQLLTGKRRLLGSEGEWKGRELRNVVRDFIVPMRDKPKKFNGDTPWCRIEDFEGKYLTVSKSSQCVDRKTIDAMNLKVHPTGTLLVSCSADLGRCAIVARPLVTNQTFIGLVVDESACSNEFLYYYMTFNADKLNSLSSGTTISYLSREQFESFEVFIPTSKHEQAAIAAVLSDMDAEIAALEQRRDKTLAIKQGMMQELLTGKTRLL